MEKVARTQLRNNLADRCGQFKQIMSTLRWRPWTLRSSFMDLVFRRGRDVRVTYRCRTDRWHFMACLGFDPGRDQHPIATAHRTD